MNQYNLNLSIILPTYNEEKNLEFIIPEILDLMKRKKYENYEIIVVDDNSNDNTAKVIKKIKENTLNVIFIERKEDNSLPLSIYEGILNSTKENIMWLDSDGSMDVEAIEKLIEKLLENKDIVFVGSRFVKDGGYKGKSLANNQKSVFSILEVICGK